jgi:hypothetical protein
MNLIKKPPIALPTIVLADSAIEALTRTPSSV